MCLPSPDITSFAVFQQTLDYPVPYSQFLIPFVTKFCIKSWGTCRIFTGSWLHNETKEEPVTCTISHCKLRLQRQNLQKMILSTGFYYTEILDGGGLLVNLKSHCLGNFIKLEEVDKGPARPLSRGDPCCWKHAMHKIMRPFPL